jgi:hypothetical protein
MSYIKNAYKYPYVTDLINNGGELNIGYTYQLGVVAIAFDEAEMYGKEKKSMTPLKSCWMMRRPK